MNHNNAERDRLNRRIRTLPKEVARELKAYRQKISYINAVAKRGSAMIYVPKGDSGFLEGEDVVPLCHQFLDQRNIDTCITA